MARARLVAVVALLLTGAAVPASATPMKGDQRVLIVLATSGAKPYSVADVQQIAAAAAAFYQTSSFGQLHLHIEVTPWVTAFASDPGCRVVSQSTLDTLMRPARLAAEAIGFFPADYDEVMYDVAGSRCGFYGTTYGHEVMLTRQPDLELLLHELGHTFGLGHSRASPCPIGCAVIDPGDPFSPMGTGDQLLDFSNYEKAVLGWLPAPPHVTASGRYVLAPTRTAGKTPRGLILDSAIGEFWLEYVARPFRGLLVRFVDTMHPIPPFAPAAILITDPVKRGREWIARGETFKVPELFKLKVLTASARQVQLRVSWSDVRH